MRFYVSYIQDCGYGAAMECHGVIEANSWDVARENWMDLLRKGPPRRAVHCAYGSSPSALFRLPSSMEGKSETDVLRRYHDDDFREQWISPEEERDRRGVHPIIRLWRRLRHGRIGNNTLSRRTLIDMARESSDSLVHGVIRSICESNQILKNMKWQKA